MTDLHIEEVTVASLLDWRVLDGDAGFLELVLELLQGTDNAYVYDAGT